MCKRGYTGRNRENDIKGVKRSFAKSITQGIAEQIEKDKQFR